MLILFSKVKSYYVSIFYIYFSLNKCALIYTLAAFDFIENNAFLTKHINTFPQLTCSANTINI